MVISMAATALEPMEIGTANTLRGMPPHPIYSFGLVIPVQNLDTSIKSAYSMLQDSSKTGTIVSSLTLVCSKVLSYLIIHVVLLQLNATLSVTQCCSL